MNWTNFSKNQQFAILALVAFALLGLTYGGFRASGRASGQEVSVVDRTKSNGVDVVAPSSQASDPIAASVVVHVAGCVKKPGVYTLKPGSRLVDAVHMAGGPTSVADMDAVNLASKIKDSQQILIPEKRMQGMPTLPIIVAAPSKGQRMLRATSTVDVPQIVNINTATIEELDKLPGVGPATAAKIIEYRTQIGRFSSIEQLEDVRGIGPKKLEKMAPFVRL